MTIFHEITNSIRSPPYYRVNLVLLVLLVLLTEFLADGPKPVDDVFEAAEDAGYSEKSVYRAKKNLGISADKEHGKHGGWKWSLPNKDAQYAQDAQDIHVET